MQSNIDKEKYPLIYHYLDEQVFTMEASDENTSLNSKLNNENKATSLIPDKPISKIIILDEI